MKKTKKVLKFLRFAFAMTILVILLLAVTTDRYENPQPDETSAGPVNLLQTNTTTTTVTKTTAKTTYSYTDTVTSLGGADFNSDPVGYFNENTAVLILFFFALVMTALYFGWLKPAKR